MEMNVNEIRQEASMRVIAELIPVLEQNNAIKFANGSFAIEEIVNGQHVWVEVSVKTKAWKDTKRTKAFNPYEAADAWEKEKKG